MAETSGFFRSVSGDRKYTTDWLAKWVSSFIGSGVYNGELAVTAGGGMSVTLPAGKAWINGYYYRNEASITLPIANADGVLHRKDTIVLRWNVNERSITAQVLQGGFASNPVAPEIVRDLELYDLKLAEISIPAGTTAITQALITDTRLDKTVCGIVTGVIDQIDTTTFYNQIAADLAQFKTTNEADFNAWFESIKDILDESTAGNLLNLINGVSDNLSTHISNNTVHITAAERTKWNGTLAGFNSLASIGLTDADFTGLSANDAFTKLLNGIYGTVGDRLITPIFKLYIRPSGEGQHPILDTIIRNKLNADLGVSATTSQGLLTINCGAYINDPNKITFLLNGSSGNTTIEYVTYFDNSLGTFKSARAANSVADAMTLSTAEPSSFIGAGKFWGVY